MKTPHAPTRSIDYQEPLVHAPVLGRPMDRVAGEGRVRFAGNTGDGPRRCTMGRHASSQAVPGPRAGSHPAGWLPLALAITALLSTGCGPRLELDDAPLDIRGEPILAPVAGAKPTRGTPAPLLTPLEPLPDDELALLGFDRLAGYDYETAAEALGPIPSPGASAIPEVIRALDGAEVAVRGFMLPLKLEGGLVQELLLMRDQSMCCFGVIPKMNEWVSVTMKPPGVKALMDQPVIIFGQLEVGEVYDNQILSSIYRMNGEELLDALDL